jgi:acyl-[acyl carrier protein]--UDP-N-acetylglucosamine O-acyltransferase
MNTFKYFKKNIKNIKIGKNNYIEKNVKIHDNVSIGNNNKIYNGTILYPNTIIGDNNIILNNNIIGEHHVDSNEKFTNKIFNGIIIGNNNFLHVNNIIFNGYYRKTEIGNNNKLLAENHIGHDTIITDNVILYPRCITGGLSKLMPCSTMGMNSLLQQNTVLGQFSMIGMGNISSHNIFPFFIYVNNKYLRFNIKKIPEELNIEIYEKDLLKIIDDLKHNNFDKNIILNSNLPENINKYLIEFYDNISIRKI